MNVSCQLLTQIRGRAESDRLNESHPLCKLAAELEAAVANYHTPHAGSFERKALLDVTQAASEALEQYETGELEHDATQG